MKMFSIIWDVYWMPYHYIARTIGYCLDSRLAGVFDRVEPWMPRSQGYEP